MAKLLVIRHSKARANEQGILMGIKLDSPLSENGITLAQKRGQELHSQSFVPDRVYTSKLKRAKQTAQIILDELGVTTEIIELTSLNERDFGEHDGKPYRFVLEAFEKYGENPPTIEAVRPFIDRILEGLTQIKEETSGTTLVVTHSNPVMVMQTALFNPGDLEHYWELGDPEYCQGFTYEF